MKKYFVVLFLGTVFSFLLAASTLQAQNLFAGGTGSKADPYAINTAGQLASLAQRVNAGDAAYSRKYYKLIADVDLSGYGEMNATFNEGKGWIPIGTYKKRFEGHFDGNGKKVTGLYINNPNLDYVGLFGIISGSVENLGVENVNTTGNSRVGGLVGSVFIFNGKVTNCYTTGTVKGHTWVGGVAGEIFSGSIVTDCYSSCTVIGNQSVGGVVGAVFDTGRLLNCYATGNVSANLYGVGGVAGYVHPANSNIINCVALNTNIIAKEQARGTETGIGRVAGNSAKGLSSNYATDLINDKNNPKALWTYSTHNSRDGADIGTVNHLSASFWKTKSNWNAVGWDENVWKIVDGKLPTLQIFSSN